MMSWFAAKRHQIVRTINMDQPVKDGGSVRATVAVIPKRDDHIVFPETDAVTEKAKCVETAVNIPNCEVTWHVVPLQ